MGASATEGRVRALQPEEFAWLSDFLQRRTGIELRPGKEAMVMARLERRMRHHGLHRYGDYLRLLDGNTAEAQAEAQTAVDLLTTNETYFYREPSHFEFLREVAVRIRSWHQPIRVWSAAASTGQEAYTMAMTLADCLPAGQDWAVVGTDVSTRVLETARRGVYPIAAANSIPRDVLKRHCLRGRGRNDGLLAVDPVVRARVTFRHANLLDPPSDLGVFDVVFLRNVMIYFNGDTKRHVVERVAQLLRPGGHLVVSHAESLNGVTDRLRLVRPSVYVLPRGRG
jgi:chemotaxis protein methyltransferase CheR